MKKNLILMIPVFLGLVGCATTVKLDGNGQKVQLVDYIKPADREKYVEIDQVTCKLGENGRSWDTNVEGCKNQVRNEAAVRGGTLVLVTSDDIKRYEMGTAMKVMSGSYRCENCVEMKGIIFKAK